MARPAGIALPPRPPRCICGATFGGVTPRGPPRPPLAGLAAGTGVGLREPVDLLGIGRCLIVFILSFFALFEALQCHLGSNHDPSATP